jgi:hypothetical protein
MSDIESHNSSDIDSLFEDLVQLPADLLATLVSPDQPLQIDYNTTDDTYSQAENIVTANITSSQDPEAKRFCLSLRLKLILPKGENK